MTDLTPETRLAAAKSIQGLLLDADWTLAELTGALSHDGLAIGLAADLALAEKVRRLCEYDFTVIVRDRAVSLWLDEDCSFTVHKWANEAQAAITEALRDD